MFKIAKARRVAWPVIISVPQSGGTVQKHKIEVEFDLLLQSRAQEVMQVDRSADQDEALLNEVVVGWSGVADEEGHPVEFSLEARGSLVDIPYVRTALIRAYFEAASGNAAARKN